MRWITPPFFILPGMAGLFFVRLFVEIFTVWTHTAVPLSITILVALIMSSLLMSLTYKNEPAQNIQNRLFPLIFLIAYLVFPRLSLKFAFFNLAFVLLVVFISFWEAGDWLKRPLFKSPFPMASLLTLFFAGVYLFTMSSDVLPADNGEFQWVVTEGGVLHPPGFPLYTMLGNGFTKLLFFLPPSSSIAVFSIITSSLTLFFVYLIVFEESKSIGWSFTAVFILGTATTFWAQATIANIRSLTGLLTVIPLYYLFKLRRAKPDSFDRLLKTAVFFTSLGVARHPSLGFFAIIFVIYVLWLDKTLLFSWQRMGKLFLITLLGLLPFLYLPLRAQSGAPGAKASLASWSGFWNHALARGFSGDFFFFIEPTILFERFRVMGNVLTFQWGAWLWAGLILGIIGLVWRDKKMALLLIGAFFLHTFITATYRAPQTVEYMVPAYVAIVLILGIGIHYLVEKVKDFPLALIVVTTLFLVSLNQGFERWSSFRYLSSNSDTRDMVSILLAEAEPDSIILADWHWFTPLRYVQDVDGFRQDVEVRFVSPDGPSYGATWANRINAELENGRSVIATHFDPDAYQSLPVARPIGEAFQFSNEPILNAPPSMQRLDGQLDDVKLLGAEIGAETAVIGTAFPIDMAWQSATQQTRNLYIHVVGFDGLLYAQDDKTVVPAEKGVTLSRFWLTLRPGSQIGVYAVYVGSGSQRQMVGTINAELQQFAPYTQNSSFAPVVGEDKTMVGYDWDQTLPNRTRLYLHWKTGLGHYSTIVDDGAIAPYKWPLVIGSWGRPLISWTIPVPDEPSHYVPFGQYVVWLGGSNLEQLRPNQTIISRLNFGTGQPLLRDTAVSVRLIGFEQDQFQWAWWDLDDSIPAMGAIPTLKWIAFSQVTAPHFVTVSEQATSGQTIGTTLRLYDAFTNQPLPILDERITSEFQWVPMAQSMIR